MTTKFMTLQGETGGRYNDLFIQVDKRVAGEIYKKTKLFIYMIPHDTDMEKCSVNNTKVIITRHFGKTFNDWWWEYQEDIHKGYPHMYISKKQIEKLEDEDRQIVRNIVGKNV